MKRNPSKTELAIELRKRVGSAMLHEMPDDERTQVKKAIKRDFGRCVR